MTFMIKQIIAEIFTLVKHRRNIPKPLEFIRSTLFIPTVLLQLITFLMKYKLKID
jgi:hypothetical protein